MKRIFAAVASFLVFTSLKAQDYEAVELNTGSFTLHNAVTGKTRSYLPVTLPANTIAWYYTVTVKKEGETNESVKLATQIANKLASGISKTGVNAASIAATIYSAIVVPACSANNKCDIFLMDNENLTLFLSKKEYFGGKKFVPYQDVSMLAVSQGKMKTETYISGTYYIGVKNATVSFINVTVEAVALVKKPTSQNTSNGANNTPVKENTAMSVESNGWTNELKEEYFKSFYLTCKNGRGINEEKSKQIARCTQSKIMSNKSFSAYQAMGWSEKEKYVLDAFEDCTKSLSDSK